MPPRSAKMKRRIFGFQRRVWWPKWTPASSRSRMETAPALVETAMKAPSELVCLCCAGRGRGAPPARRGTRATAWPPGSRDENPGRLAAMDVTELVQRGLDARSKVLRLHVHDGNVAHLR